MSSQSVTLVCPGCQQPTDPYGSQCEHCQYLHLGKLVPGPPPPLSESAGDNAASPGWYEDPLGGGQRYWDGERWGQHWLGGSAVGTAPENDGLATIGWITAILVPFVGLIVGIRLSSRNDRRGVPIAITAVVVFVAWIAFWVVLNVILANSVSSGY